MKIRSAPLIITLALGILPLLAAAQQPGRMYRIGVLSELSQDAADRSHGSALAGIKDVLRELGYVEGQNTNFEYRYAADQYDRLPALAAELIRNRVDIIIVSSTPATLAAKQATAKVPIVMASGDPVGAGLVASLARPGGNVTGVFVPHGELSGKRLQLLQEVVPGLSRVAVLWNSGNQFSVLEMKDIQVAARTLGLTLQSFAVRNPRDLDHAFAAISRKRPDALIILMDPFTYANQRRIAAFAIRSRLPASHVYREFPEVGGLMSYGVSLPALRRLIATYADKILKGAKPADLPVEQPTRFELVINLKTAKALGLSIPQSVLVQADEVIK